MKLAKKSLDAATKTLSLGDKFLFTPRNLYYELVRRDAWIAPTRSPRDALLDFRRALAEHEQANGAVRGLIRAAEARAAVPPAHLADVFDYSVRRVLVFDRVETFLLFAMNGFHRKIEVALVALEGKSQTFPEHVTRRLERQLSSGLRTAFYLVHDASAGGIKLRGRTRKLFGAHGKPLLADVGLSFAQAFRMGIPVRTGIAKPAAARAPQKREPLEDQLLLASGNYAHFEEMGPLAAMRFVYERIARGPDDLGFG
ncbi:hypothetical protein BH09MYX1_BH09MYX1_36880 [soil metagenome]